jgi:hypothetical protein
MKFRYSLMVICLIGVARKKFVQILEARAGYITYTENVPMKFIATLSPRSIYPRQTSRSPNTIWSPK